MGLEEERKKLELEIDKKFKGLLPMPPNEGPPLPRSLEIRWPWKETLSNPNNKEEEIDRLLKEIKRFAKDVKETKKQAEALSRESQRIGWQLERTRERMIEAAKGRARWLREHGETKEAEHYEEVARRLEEEI